MCPQSFMLLDVMSESILFPCLIFSDTLVRYVWSLQGWHAKTLNTPRPCKFINVRACLLVVQQEEKKSSYFS